MKNGGEAMAVDRKLGPTKVERILLRPQATPVGFAIEMIPNLKAFSRRFLVQVNEIVDLEEELARVRS